MKPSLKTLNQRAHAKKRAFQRFGIALNRELYDELNFQAAHACVIQRRTNRITIRLITVNGVRIRVVYDSHRKQIVTFLPHDGTEGNSPTLQPFPNGLR